MSDLDPRWVGASIQRQFWHFHSQLYTRYGIVLAPGEFKLIRRAIEEGTALLIKRLKGRQAIYSIRVPSAGERIYVLAAGWNLITAWPPNKRLNEIRRRLVAERDSDGELAATLDAGPDGASRPSGGSG